ncbi:MAG: sulfite exporter TauE/SafE family protein [Streptosporangiaceae bacterium]
MSTAAYLAALLGVGVLAGIVSTVASLASVVSYPALLALGLPPVSANVTNTVALMFTAVGAAAGSRPELSGQRARVLRLGLLTAAGGGAGAALLLTTPARGFEYVAPVLIAAGSLVILRRPAPASPAAAGDGTSAGGDGTPAGGDGTPAGGDGVPDSGSAPAAATREREGWGSRAGVFAVAVYVGYFGAAGGVLMLALLLRLFRQSLARTNALKNVISGLANAVAGIAFAIFGPVRWSAALPLAAGFLIGGWIGPKIVRRLPARGLRAFIGLCGLAVAVRLAVGTY